MVTVEELKSMLETSFEYEINISNISENSDLRNDIGMDSISFLYMAVMLEEKYAIQFNNDDFPKINTVKDVIDIIEQKVQARWTGK